MRTSMVSCHDPSKPQGGDFTPAYVPPKQAERQMRQEKNVNMPESSRETETEDATKDRQQREQGSQTTHNIVSSISQFADDNLTLVRVGDSSE